MTAVLLNRKVTVQIGIAGTVGKSFSDLHAKFNVKMTRGSSPNKANIVLYNVHPTTISLLQIPQTTIRLLAGHEFPRQIFFGNPIKNGVKVTKGNSPDLMVEIEAQDGGAKYQQARITVSFATATTLDQVLAACLLQLGLPTGYIKPNKVITFPRGVSISGPAPTILDQLALSVGCDWFITDGIFYLVPKKEPIAGQAITFSALNRNLIGSPIVKDKGIVEIKALIDPSMRPGGLYVIQSADVNGAFVANDVIFEGDSGYDVPFYVTVSGKRF